MIPTFFGRIQTRIFLLVVVGGLWTILITPVARVFVDSDAMGSPALSDVYKVTFTVLLVVLVLGLAWEVVYHGLMQFRWEKDWPTLFGYITIINEGILAYVVVKSLGSDTAEPGSLSALIEGLTPAPYLVAFVTTWIVVNLFANNLMQVLFIRWRFRGGRLLGGWTP